MKRKIQTETLIFTLDERDISNQKVTMRIRDFQAGQRLQRDFRSNASQISQRNADPTRHRKSYSEKYCTKDLPISRSIHFLRRRLVSSVFSAASISSRTSGSGLV